MGIPKGGFRSIKRVTSIIGSWKRYVKCKRRKLAIIQPQYCIELTQFYPKEYNLGPSSHWRFRHKFWGIRKIKNTTRDLIEQILFSNAKRGFETAEIFQHKWHVNLRQAIESEFVIRYLACWIKFWCRKWAARTSNSGKDSQYEIFLSKRMCRIYWILASWRFGPHPHHSIHDLCLLFVDSVWLMFPKPRHFQEKRIVISMNENLLWNKYHLNSLIRVLWSLLQKSSTVRWSWVKITGDW